MKKALSVILIICAVLGCLCSCRRLDPIVLTPRNKVPEDEYIRLAPGVTREMTSAEYWQKEEYNSTVMSLPQIERFNKENNKLISFGGKSIALNEYRETVSGEDVKRLINSIPLDNIETEFFVNSQQIGSEYRYSLNQNINTDGIPERVNVKFGFSTERATLRKYPTADYANNEYDDLFHDEFIMSDYMPFAPLAVLHESRDGLWYFVSLYGVSGWIEKDKTAICPSRSDWLRRQEPDEFLIVTGKNLRLADDPYCPQLSGLLLPMGTKMELVSRKEAPESIGSRYTYGNYIVRLPVRLSDGSISDAYSLIPSNSDVSKGYMPYNFNNVISLALKLQGDAYGWAGSFNSNDCSGIIREIFLCFGFEMPRRAGQQISLSGFTPVDCSQRADYFKMETLKNSPPGTFIYYQGHIMIYLGMSNSEPFVLSSVGTISTSEAKQGETFRVNAVMISSLQRTLRKNGESWLTSAEKILTLE